MVNNITHFIDFNFVPFSKSQCIKRIMCIWLLNIPFYFFKNSILFIGLFFLIINLIISICFIRLIYKFADSKSSRFICDGIMCLYVSILLVTFSYIALTFVIGEKILLLCILLCTLFLFVFLFTKLVYKYIMEDRYDVRLGNKRINSLPFIGAFSAVLLARLFFNDISNNLAVTVFSMCLLFLAFIISIGSINLVKVLLMKKVNKTG